MRPEFGEALCTVCECYFGLDSMLESCPECQSDEWVLVVSHQSPSLTIDSGQYEVEEL